jgi:hypothetical protein
MASSISILTDLVNFSPVYNRQEIYVNETDAPTKALTEFQYIFDVYIENVSTPTFRRFRVAPEPALGYGVVDIGPYCESACNSTLAQYNSEVPFSLGANADGTQSIIKVTVKYGYSYLNAGVYTVVADTVVGSDKYLFHGAITEFELMGWTPNDYLCNVTNGVNAEFLTDMKTNYVSIANLGWHHILSDIPTDVDYLVVKTYSNADFTGLIQTATKVNAVSQALTASRMFKVATGPESLNNMTGAFVTGAQPVITSSVKSYTVQLTNSASADCSEILYFVIDEPCRYEQRRIHFENKFGSFDAYNFNQRSQLQEDVRRTSYKKNKYPVTSTGSNRLYQDPSQVVNYVETQEFLTVRSDYLTTEQNDWLKQLISSPELYLEITDHTGAQNYLAYEMVTNTNWVEKETSIDKLWMLELKLKLSHSNSRQRR